MQKMVIMERTPWGKGGKGVIKFYFISLEEEKNFAKHED